MDRYFERDLAKLRGMILEMGAIAEQMIGDAVEAATAFSETLVQQVLEREERVDELCIEIDELCFAHIVKQQPVASDLRFIVACIKTNGELERIADRAVGIAIRARDLAALPTKATLADLRATGLLVSQMVHRAVGAFVARDPGEASAVIADDPRVNLWRDGALRETVKRMISDAAHVPSGLDFILIARNLERIGDHATNIAEDAIFYASGNDVRRSRRQVRSSR